MRRYWRLLGSGIVSVVVIFSALLFGGLFSPSIVEGAHGGPHALSGYAWSSNISWISFKGSDPDYVVELLSDGKFVNYAWSSNIGWISFQPNTGTTPDGTPAGVSLNGSQVTGWARACSVYPAGICSGNTLRPDSERGGWDGWISMSGTATDGSSYGVTYNPGTGQLDGFAWGADVVGWIDFCNDSTEDGADHCVTVDSLNVQCSATDANNDGRFDVDEGVTWTASVISGMSSGPQQYTFCWGDGGDGPGGIDCNVAPTDDVHAYATGQGLDHELSPVSYSTTGPRTANFRVTEEGTNKTGTNTCLIQVEDLANPTLTVFVNGGDERGKVDAGAVPAPVSGLISDCRTTSGSCTADYTVNSNVDLIATPNANSNSTDPLDPNYHYRWNDETGPICTANTSPCAVTVGAGGKSVTVTFIDQTSSVPTFTVNPGLISIEFHNAGQSARSNESILTLTSSEETELCVDSFKSFTGKSIKQIINGIPGQHDPVECILIGNEEGNSRSCSATPSNCVDISPGNSATFSVLVPEKLIQILNNSPYFIKLRAGDTLVPIRFEYRVRDIRP